MTQEIPAPPRSVDRARALEVVERHMAAEHRQDVEGAVACFTEDCYYEVPGLDMHLKGREQIADNYRRLFAALPDYGSSGEKYWWVEEGPDAPMVLYESTMEGTHLGEWEGWAPTGKRFSTWMLVRIPIAPDGLMLAEIVYFDSVDIFTQLGLIPPRGSGTERVLQRAHAGLARVRDRVPFL
jgi:steroid delta-isomerase-like uncharacterized protein